MAKTAMAQRGTTLGNKAMVPYCTTIIPAVNRPIQPELSPGGFGFSFFLGGLDATYPNARNTKGCETLCISLSLIRLNATMMQTFSTCCSKYAIPDCFLGNKKWPSTYRNI
jgi:hypothetical protein